VNKQTQKKVKRMREFTLESSRMSILQDSHFISSSSSKRASKQQQQQPQSHPLFLPQQLARRLLEFIDEKANI